MEGAARVAVVGGGPAGAHCARRLAESGCAVTLFEPRDRHEKACGGGMPARALETFPFLLDARLEVKTIRRCRLIAPSGREADVPLADPLYIFRRADLHHFLLDRAAAAGATLRRERVVSFERAGEGTAAAWSLRVAPPGDPAGPFDFLVAADGAAGAGRRRLLGAADGDGVAQGIGCYLPGVVEEWITLKFYAGLGGYLWVFPRLDHSSAGICGPLGDRPAAGLRALMDEFLRGQYGDAALEGAGRYAALIPGAPKEGADATMQGPGWALVGDAARSVDALTREGIHYAMLSGEILADALARGRPEEYQADWSRRCASGLEWAAAHGDAFFDARFLESLVALCGRSPAIARVLSDLIAGRQEYGTLKRRLILAAPAAAWQTARSLLSGDRGSRSNGR